MAPLDLESLRPYFLTHSNGGCGTLFPAVYRGYIDQTFPKLFWLLLYRGVNAFKSTCTSSRIHGCITDYTSCDSIYWTSNPEIEKGQFWGRKQFVTLRVLIPVSCSHSDKRIVSHLLPMLLLLWKHPISTLKGALVRKIWKDHNRPVFDAGKSYSIPIN